MPYTSAEIPPAGAPSGFDCAAWLVFALADIRWCRSAQDDTEVGRTMGYNLFVGNVTTTDENCITHATITSRVILSGAAQISKNKR